MRCSGVLGYVTYEDSTSPGIFSPVVVEQPFKGELLRKTKIFTSDNNGINGTIINGNSVLLYSTAILKQNTSDLKYIRFAGESVNWSISTIDSSSYPKIIVSLGPVYYENSEE